ncbi:efflux transporter, RND family, MFP subunit [Emticicia oligotrophica DSM 17448]|uniref:Efflux transporter, RND family, MFP subunit n=1 Tax=Emticicia oligotrophica (strain DSM 17448 / CIP 109782 / MTCC 6937 / GPTSA100-15) TaxID=929562 RepID=A0ABN4ANA1_EMTOG|nr:efflux RND transporter periplasmic adaptor subunit [Emticicia oligotrophica]AFK03622.1 efflux transporter, RND family, MFP subunit [Emticicia oligotrophica DSM 17448]
MKKSNRIWLILGGIVALLVIFLLVAKSAGWIGKEKPTEVEFVKASKSDITETVSASGKIQPEVEVKITPDVPGEIIALYVKEGDSVKKGQLLLKIQPENYISITQRAEAVVNQTKASAEQAKSTIAQSEARLARVQMEYNRQKKLFEDKVVSAADLEVAETNLKVARQDLEAARANVEAAKYNVKSAEAGLKDASENLRKTSIYAPMSGIVSKLAVELGERVVGTSQMAGTEMLRIANLNNMEVRINVNENDIVRVSLGDTAMIDVDSYAMTGKKFKGIVTEIANTANGSGTAVAAASTDAVTEFEVRIRILPESYRDLVDRKTRKVYPFKPGMTATVDIITEKKTGVLSVPIAAVTTRGANDATTTEKKDGDKNEAESTQESKTTKKDKPKEVVFVHDKDKVKMREVKTGITDTSAGTIEVISGLKEGEEIVSGPFVVVSKKLKDGDVVTKKVEKKEDKEKKKD